MTEELLRQISEVVEGDEQGRESRAPINIVIGDGSTVVIGSGSINKGEKEGGEEGGGQRRRACNQGEHRELRRLRRQVRMLKRLLTARGGVFNRRPATPRHRRTSNDQAAVSRANVSNRPTPRATTPHRAPARATLRSSAHQPAPTHINPVISSLMTAHIRGDGDLREIVDAYLKAEA